MKIYISSTYEDLKLYREAVCQNLRSMRQHVIAMEDYVATDRRPLEECLRDVAEVDLYIGIFAWRYGYVPSHGNPDGRSITELEYRKANELGKQCLIFILDKGVPWSPDFMDSHTHEGDDGKRIQQLRDELVDRYTVGFFRNPDQLANAVGAAVFRVVNDMSTPPDMETAPAEGATPVPRDSKRASPRDGRPKLWTPGNTVRLSFLDGDELQRRLVQRFAPIWTAYANLQFEFVDDADSEVRISFKGSGSWSFIGTDALNADETAPTINFGWLTRSTHVEEAERVILHEIGHILGLLHEHNNPEADIQWNKEIVYRDLSGPPNHMPQATVDHNIFSRWNPDVFPAEKPFDLDSLMLYRFPDEWTHDDVEFRQNDTISTGDKEFVARLYPYQ